MAKGSEITTDEQHAILILPTWCLCVCMCVGVWFTHKTSYSFDKNIHFGWRIQQPHLWINDEFLALHFFSFHQQNSVNHKQKRSIKLCFWKQFGVHVESCLFFFCTEIHFCKENHYWKLQLCEDLRYVF